MKPVEIMLNFLRKKTSKKNDGTGRNGEPPIMMLSPSEGVSPENIRVASNRSEKPRSRSEVFEKNSENGNAAYENHFRSLHLSCSSSLDETRFTAINNNISPQRVYVKNQRKASLASESESQGDVLRPLNEEPAKLTHSPKFPQKLSTSDRSSGHSKSLSTITSATSRSVERKGAIDPLRSSVDVTPRLYRKNAQHKPLPWHAASTDPGLNDSTATESSLTGILEYQWSFWDKVSASPVPPPRKKRSKGGGDCEGEKSSQTSSSPEALSETGPSRKTSASSESKYAFDSTNVDSAEFVCNLPNDFSDLGLDILNIPSAALSSSTEKSNFDLVRKIGEGRTDPVHDPESSPSSPENRTLIKSGDVLRIEPSDFRILDSEKVVFNSECSSSFSDSFFDSIFRSDVSESSKKSSLRSETIVKSIFMKSQKQSDDILSCAVSKIGEDRDIDSSAKDCEDISQQQSSSFPIISDFNFTSRISDVFPNTENHSLHLHENSADENHSTFPKSESESMRCGETLIGSVRPPQPDVLIGTQRNPLNRSLSSPSSPVNITDQLLNPIHHRDHSAVNAFNRDLSVHHQLNGFTSKTLVAVNEKSTSRKVIENILKSEKIAEDWFLFKLCLNSHNPRNGKDGALEFKMDDIPARHLCAEEDRTEDGAMFEIQRREGRNIRISCDASIEKPRTVAMEISCTEKPRTVAMEISCDVISRFVIEAAIRKFNLNSPTKFVLIEVNRSRKDLLMRRVGDSEVLAQLTSDHFLLCEKELLFESSAILTHSPKNSTWTDSLSRLSYLPIGGGAFDLEIDTLKKKLLQLEMKLVNSEKLSQQKFLKQQSRLGRYRIIALCTDPNEKMMLLEKELNLLTEETLKQEKQILTQQKLSQKISDSNEDAKNSRENLLSMEDSLAKIADERKEIHDCLINETTKIQKQTVNGCGSSSDLFRICQNSQGSSIYSFEMDQSKLNGVELFPCSERNGHCLRVGRSNGCRHLSEGDRILEINGQAVHHLNEIELVDVLGKTIENLRVVILREEVPNKNIYKL